MFISTKGKSNSNLVEKIPHVHEIKIFFCKA